MVSLGGCMAVSFMAGASVVLLVAFGCWVHNKIEKRRKADWRAAGGESLAAAKRGGGGNKKKRGGGGGRYNDITMDDIIIGSKDAALDMVDFLEDMLEGFIEWVKGYLLLG